MEKKYVIVIQSGVNDMGRAYHGLFYGIELYRAGYEVEIYFDGTGTQLIKEFAQPKHPFNSVYVEALEVGIIKGACGYCANYLKTKEEIESSEVNVLNEEKHFSLTDRLEKGYFPLIL
ncbi:hypothetical protein [Alkalihalobacillus sp. TS-13]|uniref:hypothetical protein n=1 Tax=Alkalihalobacillus sp. TS-13 TaxID=2842455 RepID=UPI001C882D9C|nr:hypothetical protein [Alkalihalobacillus sp. TS-13]